MMIRLAVPVIFAAVCSYICYRRAKKLNRDEMLWSLLGALFGLFAIIVVFLLEKKSKEDDQTE